jgi:hypothetical protein
VAVEYPLGQPVTIGPITVQQRNTDGTYTLVDASTVTTVVYLAAVDGTQTTTGTYASPTHISLGKYQQDVPTADLTVIGHYQYVVTTTGTGAGVTVGDFDVYDPKRTAVISLADGKDMLNIPQATTTSDAEIAAYIATIESSLRGMLGGPIVNKTITAERVEFAGWYEMLQVRQRPLVSVTSITSITGTVIDITAGLDINPAARTIRRKDGSAFSTDSPVALVTYVAGWGTAVPPAVNLAARIILSWLWETQHGPAARPSMGGVDLMATVPGFPYAIPNGAAELLKGHLNGLAFMDEVFAW